MFNQLLSIVKKFNWVIKITLSIILVLWLINKLDLQTFIRIVSDLDWKYYSIGLLLLIFGAIATDYRWQLSLVSLFQIKIAFIKLLEVTMSARFLSQFLPTAYGGDISKPFLIKYIRADISYKKLGFSILIDRILGFIGLLLVLLTGLLFQPKGLVINITDNQKYIFLIITTLGILLLMYLIILIQNNPTAHSLLTFIKPMKFKVITILLIAYITQLISSIVAYYFGMTLNIYLPIEIYLIIVPLVQVTTLLPVSINGIGVREISFVTLLSVFGIKAEQAVALSLLLYFSFVVFSLFGGLLIIKNQLENIKPASHK